MGADAVTPEKEGCRTVLSPMTASHKHVHWGLHPLPSLPQNALLQSMTGNPEWLGRSKPAIVFVLFLVEHKTKKNKKRVLEVCKTAFLEYFNITRQTNKYV